MFNGLISVFGLLFLHQALAKDVSKWPGSVPLNNIRDEAVDLSYKGRRLNPSVVAKLSQEGSALEYLDPVASDIWRPNGIPGQRKSDQLDRGLYGDVVYLGPTPTRAGLFRFLGKVKTDQGTKNYTFILGRKAHNILLRKEVLRKMGYRVPGMKYLPYIDLKLSNILDAKGMANCIALQTGLLPSRWIGEDSYNRFFPKEQTPTDEGPSGEKEEDRTCSTPSDKSGNSKDSLSVRVYDVMAVSSDDLYYNIQMGKIPQEVVKGRRVMRSLVIPYALAYIPESVNKMRWEAGRVDSGHVILDYDAPGELRPSASDAKWAVMKIAAFTRKDFEEIVRYSFFPTTVGKLIVEKMISRRNSLVKFFNLPYNPLKVNPEISWGKYLVKGKILKQRWGLHASRYAFGDPDSPLSRSEIFSYVKSQAISNGLRAVTAAMNEFIMPKTDLQTLVELRQRDRLIEGFLGISDPTKFGVYTIPRFGVRLIGGRSIVLGAYQGTDNKVQLADTIGVSGDIGLFIGLDGITPPVGFQGDARVGLQRTYTHIRPVVSIKKAIKTPFKNILVPLTLQKLGEKLEQVLHQDLPGQKDPKKAEEVRLKLIKLLKPFKDSLGVGESIIITDTFSARAGLTPKLEAIPSVGAQLPIRGDHIILSRVHIHRASEDAVQVYRARGRQNILGVSFGLGAYLQVFEARARYQFGNAETKLYQLNLSPDLSRNPRLISQIVALKEILLSNDTESLEVATRPYIIKNNFVEANKGVTFLVWKWDWNKQRNLIELEHPLGGTIRYYRRFEGERKGKDFQNLGVNIVNALIKEGTDSSLVQLAVENNGRPGDTLFGESLTRGVIFEGEITRYKRHKGEDYGKIKSPFINLAYRHRGWGLNQKKLKKLLADMKKKFKHEFYNPWELVQTKELKLYQINVDLYFYEKGVDSLVKMTEKNLSKILNQNGNFKVERTQKLRYIGSGGIGTNLVPDGYETYREAKRRMVRTISKKVLSYIKDYLKHKRVNNIKKQVRYLSKAISLLEASLTFKGLSHIAGGDENLYLSSRLSGFRENDENGDQTLFGHTLGEVGSKDFAGPLRPILEKTKATPSEFFLNWMLGQFI